MTLNVLSLSGDSTSSVRRLKLAPLMLLASACVLSACGSAGGTDAASALGKKVKVTNGGGGSSSTTSPTPTPTPTPTTVTYDTSIGNAVDVNGFADLPLRSGAHRYYVSSATGSDNNSCAGAQNPSAPKATIASAAACIADSNGDQVLVAEGTTYREGLPNMNGRRGFSPLYPTVIQSYDPADAANESKYGRATGSNRPVINTAASGMDLGGGGGAHPDQPAGKFVVRGFDVNPGNIGGMYLKIVPSSYGTNDYILFENNIFRYTMVSAESSLGTGQANHFILRNNSFYGSWNATDHVQGAFVDNVANVTFEDNVFWHNGWKVGANRDDPIASGGLTGDEVFRHAFYLQNDTTNNIVRRNLIVDGPADGGQYRGDSTVTENVYIDNPMAVALGGGTNYNMVRPNGVALEFAYNAILGDADITSNFPRGEAISSENGTLASSAHNNLIARSRNPSGVNVWAFGTGALFNQASYMTYDHNTVYQWATASGTHVDNAGPYASQIHASYTNNIWDGLASGTNTNVGTATFPNPYTAAQLYAALGFADKQSFINYAIAHPEAHIQRNARALLFTGYGVN